MICFAVTSVDQRTLLQSADPTGGILAFLRNIFAPYRVGGLYLILHYLKFQNRPSRRTFATMGSLAHEAGVSDVCSFLSQF